MKFKAILLYSIGVFLLIFGNRGLWEKLKEDRNNAKQEKESQEAARKAASQKFEVQQLVYDSTSKKWKNPTYYFQLLHVGDVNFKALKQTHKKTSIETDDHERASDSK